MACSISIREVPMEPTTNSPPTQHVYRAHGSHSVRVPVCEDDDAALLRLPTIADLLPARRIMSRDVICARDDLEVGALMDLMVRRHIGCVPIVDDRGRPIGMITKFDLVEQLLAARGQHGVPAVTTAGQVMMPLALTLDEHATIAHAAAMMSIEDVHHVAIVAGSGALIGIVSTMDIVRWLAANDGVLAGDDGLTPP
jgi:CBS domain-containing protein